VNDADRWARGEPIPPVTVPELPGGTAFLVLLLFLLLLKG